MVNVQYELCDLEDFLMYKDKESKDFMSHEEFLQLHQPKPANPIGVTDNHENEWRDAVDAGKPGDIEKLLQGAPGIIQHRAYEGFANTAVETKPLNQPAVIQNGKTKFFLDENYFKFHKDNSLKNVNNDKMNNLNTRKKVNGKSHSNVNNNDYNSCEDNCDVRITPNYGNKTKPQTIKKPDKKYYNAFEIYEMKRGKKNA